MKLFEFFSYWRSYTKANKKNWKGLFIILHYLIARYFVEQKSRFWLLWLLSIPYQIYYRFFIEWVLGIEIPAKCKIGKGLIIDHGQGIVLNKNTVIGDNCRLRNSVCIGNKELKGGGWTDCPRLGSNINIGANAVILMGANIGDYCIVGAGAVVNKNIPDYSVVGGVPAKIIGKVEIQNDVVTIKRA